MDITNVPNLKDVKLISLNRYNDDRGSFISMSKVNQLMEGGVVLFNQSISKRGVFRGMHHQIINPQTKLVSCPNGSVFDIVYDMRTDSPTYGNFQIFHLNSPEIHLLVPRGYLHGFIALEDNTIFQYLVDNIYDPKHEESLPLSIIGDMQAVKSRLNVVGLTLEELITSKKDKLYA
jgi:dTDP-4-dehydrorhamnose 3,5-epimerase